MPKRSVQLGPLKVGSRVPLGIQGKAVVESQAGRTFDLESLVLCSCEALDAVVPKQRIEDALEEQRCRRETQKGWIASLRQR